MADDTADQQPRRGSGRPFEPGQSGNPSGRPAGSRNAATRLVEAMFEDEAETIGRRAIEMALGGDTLAMKLVLERLVPLRRGRPVQFELPAIHTSADVVAAIGQVLRATAAGDLTPDEAATVAGILDAKRRAIETVEFEGRLEALEKQATQEGL